jgi:hypothetical protein
VRLPAFRKPDPTEPSETELTADSKKQKRNSRLTPRNRNENSVQFLFLPGSEHPTIRLTCRFRSSPGPPESEAFISAYCGCWPRLVVIGTQRSNAHRHFTPRNKFKQPIPAALACLPATSASRSKPASPSPNRRPRSPTANNTHGSPA